MTEGGDERCEVKVMTITRPRWIQARDRGDDGWQKELNTGELERCLLVSVSRDDERKRELYTGEHKR